MKDMIPTINAPMTEDKARLTNPVVLAFVGDAVESLYVRSVLVDQSSAKAHQLHLESSRIVNATSQSRRMDKMLDVLSEDELAVYRRAKNSKTHTSAKHAELMDYKNATGLEAVYGYLYLIGATDRLAILLEYTYNDINRK